MVSNAEIIKKVRNAIEAIRVACYEAENSLDEVKNVDTKRLGNLVGELMKNAIIFKENMKRIEDEFSGF
jgi:hypothetical protein